MGLFTTIINDIKAAAGYQQDFESLLAAKDVNRALNLMKDHSIAAEKNLKDYNVGTHEVMDREDKPIYDKKGNFLRFRKRWKIAIPYQRFINEIALVFLYGRPVKWTQESDGTDDVFETYKKTLKETRFNAHVREAKRRAGAEGMAAILYHVYRDNEGKPQLLLNVLSKSNNDDLYTVKDQYGRLKAFGWGYSLTDAGNKTVRHVDIYMDHVTYQCKRGVSGWEVNTIENPIGKKPVIIFEQEVEHDGVQSMIDRSENKTSVDADVNDRFANPAMVADSKILNSLPKEEDEAKLYIVEGGGNVNYLTWDDASQSKENEYKRLDDHILSKSFTPKVDFDSMKSLSDVSAKALKQMMMLAVIKADMRKETHDGYMSRAANLMIAILGNVLDYKNKSKYEALKVGHEFQEPFGEDVSAVLNDLLKQYEAGALSLESVLEQSYLVKNSEVEKQRIEEDQAAAMERQRQMSIMDAFQTAE